MATQQALKALALTARQQQAQLQLPNFPKLSQYSPKLAKIDPAGVAAYEQALQEFMRGMTFAVQGQGNPVV